MSSEAPLEQNEHGLAATGPGWFVVNAREARWAHAPGRGAFLSFDVGHPFEQLGVNLVRLTPGEPATLYHHEANQEDFLVLAGDALLIVEGQERPLRQWDLVHCAPGTNHTIVGAERPCLILAVGARAGYGPGWGAYTVDDAALRHGAGVERETTDPREAYAAVAPDEPTAYRDGWLPG